MIRMSTKFQITLPEDLFSDLRRAARGEDRSAADVVREAIREWISGAREKRKGRRAGRFGPLERLHAIHTKGGASDDSARVDEILYDEP